MNQKEFSLDEAKEIGDKLGINWDDISLDEFSIGINFELEHGIRFPSTNVTNDEPLTTGKIALAHLNEFPDYYTRLTKMEAEALTRNKN